MRAVPGTSQVSRLLTQMHAGDAGARDRLIAYLSDRLQKLARRMLRRDRLRRWEEADDLLQQSLLRLHRCLECSKVTHSEGLLNLAAREMRLALIDFARHYFGPHGTGTHQQGLFDDRQGTASVRRVFVSVEQPPEQRINDQDAWQSLYQEIEALPELDRQIVDLLWICGLTQVEAAAALGVERITVIRRWRRARMRLHEALADRLAEM